MNQLAKVYSLSGSRPARRAAKTLFLLLFSVLALDLSAGRAADYEGAAVVVDDDTIELHVDNKVIPPRSSGDQQASGLVN